MGFLSMKIIYDKCGDKSVFLYFDGKKQMDKKEIPSSFFIDENKVPILYDPIEWFLIINKADKSACLIRGTSYRSWDELIQTKNEIQFDEISLPQ